MGFSDWGAEYGISLFGVAARDEVDGLCQWDGRWRTGCLGVRLAVLDRLVSRAGGAIVMFVTSDIH